MTTETIVELGSGTSKLLPEIQQLINQQTNALKPIIAQYSKAVKRVQRLTLNGTNKVTISAVDLTKTIVVLNCESSSWAIGATHVGITCENYARLISSTELSFSFTKARYSSGNVYAQAGRGYVEVVEFV